MDLSTQDVDWTFDGTWPYESHRLDTTDGCLQYVDQGADEGDLTVLLHGNPTWGYLYRHFIPAFTERGARVVVPDLLGFGRSDKPRDASAYTVDRHVERLADLLAVFGDRPVTLVAHDWGGPIGLAWAASHLDRLRRLVLMNTFGPELPGPLGGGPGLRVLRRVVRWPGVATYLYQRRNVMVEDFLLDKGLARPDMLNDQARQAYRAPHQTVASRVGIAAFPLQIPRSPTEPAARLSRHGWGRLHQRLGQIPVLLVWGTQDVLFGSDVLKEWQQAVPHAEVVELESAGHYLQEDEPEAVVAAVIRGLQLGAEARSDAPSGPDVSP